MSYDEQGVVDNAQQHDDQENTPTNTSGNKPFAAVLEANVTRRSVMAGSLTAAAAGFLAPKAVAKNWGNGNNKDELVGFDPVKIEDVTDITMPTISDDYEYQVLAPWGTPIEPGITEAYEGDPNTRPTSKQATLQTGIGHDGMWFFPWDLRQNFAYGHGYRMRSDLGMLCVNHEFGRNTHVLGKSSPESLEDVRLAQNVLGVSVLKVKEARRGWKVVKSKHTRRITANTPVTFSGPAADSHLLQNDDGNIALGTLNNCGSGYTPWGTYLTCEENFNGYFGTPFVPDIDTTGLTEEEIEAAVGAAFAQANADLIANEQDADRAANLTRYGFSVTGFGYSWQFFDKRFNLEDPDYANEMNRFGWIVEIDPFDGTQKPVKRTALGRFKHEAIAIAEASNGRIAAYMGDDQRFDYCYKYLSDRPWKEAIHYGKSPLDEGSLYVAKFNDDGTGEWLELTIDNPILADRFESQAEVLIYARIAADLLGATPMDRPEWTTIGKNGEVFWTCTNNSRRTEPNAANPEAPNNDGHIIRTYDDADYQGNTFAWDIYLLASSTRGTEGVFTDPDAAWADEDGRLFIGTDGGQPDGLQDQLVVFDTHKDTPDPQRLLVGVDSDEITGFAITPDQRTAFINIQHPGDGNPTKTNFPLEFDGVTVPRDCTLVIRRKDGGVIGS